MNILRASRTLIIPEADTVDDVEGYRMPRAIASLVLSGGVCDAGMHETAKPRNLGDPECSLMGKSWRRMIANFDDVQEVRLLHSTEETE